MKVKYGSFLLVNLFVGIFWDYLGIYNILNIQWGLVRVRLGFPLSLYSKFAIL